MRPPITATTSAVSSSRPPSPEPTASMEPSTSTSAIRFSMPTPGRIRRIPSCRFQTRTVTAASTTQLPFRAPLSNGTTSA
jgi:hypothetical protein